MGFAVLAALVITEVALLVLSLRTQTPKPQWRKWRAVVSTGEALALLTLMILPFPQVSFDFRWIGLLAVLVLRAAIALASLFLGKDKDADMPRKALPSVAGTIASLLVLAFASIPSLVFPYYGGLPTTGTYQVKEVGAIMVDASRDDPFEGEGSHREVPVRLYYPDVTAAGESAKDHAGTFPLVVFSHGAFGYHQSNYSLYAELASHGYVVAALDYPHQAFFAPSTSGKNVLVDMAFLQQAIDMQNGAISDDESFAIEQEWMQLRMADLGFAIDTLKDATRAGATEEGAWHFETRDDEQALQDALSLADLQHIGLVGHSMGGATSVGQGRVRSDVGAVVDLDGTMLTERLAFDGTTYTYNDEPYPVPLLSIDNERHWNEGMQVEEVTGQPYVNNYMLDNALTSAHTYFVGSEHMNFTDLPLFSPTLASLLGTGSIDSRSCIEQTNALVLAWFDQ